MRPRTARTLLLDEREVSDDLLQHTRRLGASATVRKVAGSQFVSASRTERQRILTCREHFQPGSIPRTLAAAGTSPSDPSLSRSPARRQRPT
jgi:hypothetical protein